MLPASGAPEEPLGVRPVHLGGGRLSLPNMCYLCFPVVVMHGFVRASLILVLLALLASCGIPVVGTTQAPMWAVPASETLPIVSDPSVPLDDVPLTGVPENIRITPGPGYVVVSWEFHALGAAAFVVYRTALSLEASALAQPLAGATPARQQFAWERLGEVSAGERSYRDATASTKVPYTYAVAVRDASGRESPLSDASISSFTLSISVAGPVGSVSSEPAGIACGSACVWYFDRGTTVTLTAETPPGATFTGWTGADDCTGTDACAVTMNQMRSVTATFATTPNETPNETPDETPTEDPFETHHTLTVTRLGTGSGTVTSAPAGITCGDACGAPYAHDTLVTLAATPAAGSTFTGWTGADHCSASDACAVAMSESLTVSATFTLLETEALPPPTAALVLQASSDTGDSDSDNLTAAPAVVFDVTFSTDVTGLSASAFSLHGTATRCKVHEPDGSGASYTLTVSGCRDGTLTLYLDAFSVSDGAGTAGPGESTAAAGITIDRTPPSVLSFNETATPLTLRLTFSENVRDLAASDFTFTGRGATGCTIGALEDAGDGATYALRISGCSSTGRLTVSLRRSSVVDGAGNAGPHQNTSVSLGR
jgi:hypothetical protein